MDKALYDHIFQLVFTADDLLDLFEVLNDEASLKVLANLGSYYIGEDPGERYSCIVLAKGQAILPYLQAILDQKCDECIQKFGSGSDMCQKRDWYLQHTKSLIDRIHRNERCPKED